MPADSFPYQAIGTCLAQVESESTRVKEGPGSKDNICYSILAYLFENPQAQDTFEGIVEWWLLQQEIHHNSRLVQEALFDLVERDLLIEREREHLRTYCINPEKYQEISLLLEKKNGRR